MMRHAPRWPHVYAELGELGLGPKGAVHQHGSAPQKPWTHLAGVGERARVDEHAAARRTHTQRDVVLGARVETSVPGGASHQVQGRFTRNRYRLDEHAARP